MADDSRYADEIRLPITITLPGPLPLTPVRRSADPAAHLPTGLARGTVRPPAEAGARSLLEHFAAMDIAMRAEGTRARARQTGRIPPMEDAQAAPAADNSHTPPPRWPNGLVPLHDAFRLVADKPEQEQEEGDADEKRLLPHAPLAASKEPGTSDPASSGRLVPRIGGAAVLEGDKTPLRAAERETKVSAEASTQTPKLLQGHQNKHIEGTNNYIPGRSTLTADPSELLEKYAGRGERRGKIPVGKPGSREAFDAGRIIGTYRNESGDFSALTTRGNIHYSKKGAHIVPVKPKDKKP